jgi:hypothetical protein
MVVGFHFCGGTFHSAYFPMVEHAPCCCESEAAENHSDACSVEKQPCCSDVFYKITVDDFSVEDLFVIPVNSLFYNIFAVASHPVFELNEVIANETLRPKIPPPVPKAGSGIDLLLSIGILII